MSIHLAIFGKPRYLGLLDIEAPLPVKGSWIVVETMRGTEMALLGGALSPEQEARYRASCNDDAPDNQVKGGEPSLQEISLARLASREDLSLAAKEREEEDEVLMKARILLRNHNLPMKLVDVEYLLDRKKLFLYFTSEQRVDFRAYVRDLAKEFKTRIELRQIGVRDEAKTVKGIAPCGRECCCSQWLHKFTPICIKMVKEQNLALNPTKISGICGRLMCCMSYEHNLYGALWKSLPNPGSKIRTPNGNFVVDGIELSSDSVRIRRPEGGSLMVAVEDFPRFKETVMEGREWEDVSRRAQDGLFPEASSGRSPFSFSGAPGQRKRASGRTSMRESHAAGEGSESLPSDPKKPAGEKDRRAPHPMSEGAKPPKRKKRKKPPVQQEERKPQPEAQGARRPKPLPEGGNRPSSGETAPKGRPLPPVSDGTALKPDQDGKPPRRRQSSRRRRPGKGQSDTKDVKNTPEVRDRSRDQIADKKRHKGQVPGTAEKSQRADEGK